MASRLFATLPAVFPCTADEMVKAVDGTGVVTWDPDSCDPRAIDARSFLIDGLQSSHTPPVSPQMIMEMFHGEDRHPARECSPMPLASVVAVATGDRHHLHLDHWSVVRVLLACAQSDRLLPLFKTVNIASPRQGEQVPCLQMMRMQGGGIKMRAWLLSPNVDWHGKPVSWLFGSS